MAGPPGLPRSARYGGALVCGALPVLAFPAPGLSWLAWFGLVPGLLLMRAAPTAGSAALAGWWFGAGYLLAALYWMIPNLGPGLLPIVTILGVLWSGAGAACHVLLRNPLTVARTAAALAVVPSCWVLSEWLRSWQGFGGPWAVLGATQWQHPAVLSLAAAGGVWLVTAVLVIANVGLAAMAVAAKNRHWPAALTGLAAAAAAVAAGPVAFALTAGPATARTLTIDLVQPGVTSPAARDTASQLLSAGLGRGRPGLIAWGESSIAFDLRTDRALLTRLERLSAADGAQLLVGQDSVSPGGAKSKVAVLVGPGGIRGTYTKTRLVPFGEYIPFRQQLGWLARISRAAPQNMVPGTGARVLTAAVPGGPLRLGVLICFESAFPDMARADVQQGAQLIVYQTSDSTFQDSWELAQHASLAAVRAAETGRPAVQAALTGDSAAFDARGRLLAWADGSYRGVLAVRLRLPPASYLTPFDRLGPYVPWTALVVVVIAVAVASVRAGRPRRILWNRNLRRRPDVCPVGDPPVADPAQGGRKVRHGSKSSRWRGAAGATMTAAALALVLSACQGTNGSGAQGPGTSGGGTSSSPTPAGPKVTITPDTGTKGARPDHGITVTAADGTISSVSVKGGVGEVEGSLNAAKTEWHTQWALSPATHYTVTAVAADTSGHQVTQTSSFRTLRPPQTFGTQIFEGLHQTYGVGMPIMLTFSAPIKNKAAVEKSLQITTSKPVYGAWYWVDDQHVNFRPRGYWPAHTKVSFAAHLDGVHAGPGLWGTHTLTQDFSIGRSLIVVASTAAHHLKLFQDGKLAATWPISTGKPGDDTPNGTYVTIEKGNPVEMKGPGYDLQVPWSVRITWSGIYLHDAPWSVGSQGSTNVSHGCVNMAPANAEAYYNMELTGDPVTIMGSSRAGVWGNGWTDWFLPWKKYLTGSALGEVVSAGPDGSTFVSPSALPPYQGSAPIAGPPLGSADAA